MTTTEERIYEHALGSVRRQWGPALDQLGDQLKRALILAEVLTSIGAQDNESNPMVKIAAHAVIRSVPHT